MQTKKRSAADRAAEDRATLDRIESGHSKNDQLAIAAFMGRGIPLDDLEPRVNILTYRAWRAKGRQVRKGAQGVKLGCIVERERVKNGKTETVKVPWTFAVFHISQTDPIA